MVNDADLFARLSWLLIPAVAGVQVLAAIAIKRRLQRRVLGAVVLATVAAMATALLIAAVADDPRRVIPWTAPLFFLPGLPPLVALLRNRIWVLAALLFVAPPLFVLTVVV